MVNGDKRRSTNRYRPGNLWGWLVGIAVVALVGLVVLFLLLASHDRSSLWVQVGKGLIDLIVVGVLGASIKLLVDEHQDRRLDDERRQDFRQDKYNRIVCATNTLRRAPMLIKPTVRSRPGRSR